MNDTQIVTSEESPVVSGLRSWPDVLVALMKRQNLDDATAAWAMDEIMSGSVPDTTMAAFLVAHHGKGETVEEISGLVRAMMEHAVELEGLTHAVDIVGTGGDRAKTVNISSTAAFVIAAAGQPVVKHGNRATSSASGSADVLESLGFKLDLDPGRTREIASEVGIGFAFANVFHPAMRFIAPVRKAIAVPSAFNILGPLTNPARTKQTAIGVADLGMAPLVAGVLAERGDSALVFRSQDGLDEFSTTAVNDVWEVRDHRIIHSQVDAIDLGLARATKDDLRGGDPEYNAQAMKDVLGGADSPVADVVVLNAAAALTAAESAPSGSLEERLAANMDRARAAIADHGAAAKLDELIAASRA